MYWELVEKHGSSKGNFIFIGEALHYIGFELELDKVSTENQESFREHLAELLFLSPYREHYLVEKDSSLKNGMELITHPHSLSEMWKFIDEGLTPLLKQIK